MHKLCPKQLLHTICRQVNKILSGELVNVTQGSNVIITASSRKQCFYLAYKFTMQKNKLNVIRNNDLTGL